MYIDTVHVAPVLSDEGKIPSVSYSLCQAEIAKCTAAYTKVVCDLKLNLIGADAMMGPHPSREIGHALLPLPLPSDAILSEFRQLIQPHILELAI